MISRAVLALILLGAIQGSALAEEPLVLSGSYEITYRLELPHLERWAIERIVTTCVSEAVGVRGAMLPLLSDNNPFAGCTAKGIQQDETKLTYDIACEGRDSAKARAIYSLAPGGFRARIAMTMGAKNMTMTEIQTGRRIGDCNLASTGPE